MQLSDPRVAAAQFTTYNSLANLPVSFGSATVFVWLGATGDLTTTMIGATALLALAKVVLALIRVGHVRVEPEPVPRID